MGFNKRKTLKQGKHVAMQPNSDIRMTHTVGETLDLDPFKCV